MAKGDPKPISLALQGGGSHGAFTWGVLDGLLEQGSVLPKAMTATSAGAMNAVAMAHGWVENGAEGAREKLWELWNQISRRGALAQSAAALFPSASIGAPNPLAAFSPMSLFSAFSSFASPYDFNPFDYNPLRSVVEDVIDFSVVRRCKDLSIYLAATNVESGRVDIFTGDDLSVDAVMASACLPQLFKAVEIDGKPYWDGGYLGNPSLFPLIYNEVPRDILLVMLNPIRREGTPRSAGAIADRLNEITFNAPLMGELRAIAFVQKLLDENWLADRVKGRYRRLNLHAIRADEELCHLDHESKYDTSWSFLQDLRDRGRREAARWLEANAEDVGKASTISIQQEFLTD